MVSVTSCVTMLVVMMLMLVVAEIAAKPLAEGQVTGEKSVAITLKDSAVLPNDVADARSVVADQEGVESNLAIQTINLTEPPKDTYKLETEGLPSKVLTVYDRSQSYVGETFLHPRPLVDTIQEHEKYGNTGDKFYPVGRAIVNGFEGFSNLLNSIIDAPVEIAKKLSRQLTGTLNAVGGKIVGL